ncbi:MAG: NUDIX domain-containing protein [Sulfurovum sp.]|nr:MAG: NUDIX domain-containing protein [Sulfurovum sp.]
MVAVDFEIKNFTLGKLEKGKYIESFLASYEQNGNHREWELVKAHRSVAILIYHRQKDAFILVKQFRPAVYNNNGHGVTYELCAGLVDKDISLQQIAQEEIFEECGYQVKIDSVQKITSFYSSVGFAGAKQTLYYCEVEESDKINNGGGIDTEEIIVEYLPTSKAKTFIFDEDIAKTSGLMFAFLWWFEHKSSR